MTDLERKAIEMALNYFESAYELDLHEIEIRDALRKALRENALEQMVAENQRLGLYDDQLEQESAECMCGICKLGKREWVGITKEDKKEILEMTQPDERGYVIAITEAKLKEKNT